jgi:hypothetical protein
VYPSTDKYRMNEEEEKRRGGEGEYKYHHVGL